MRLRAALRRRQFGADRFAIRIKPPQKLSQRAFYISLFASYNPIIHTVRRRTGTVFFTADMFRPAERPAEKRRLDTQRIILIANFIDMGMALRRRRWRHKHAAADRLNIFTRKFPRLDGHTEVEAELEQQKKEIISKFQQSPKDTGSAHVQVATITARIDYLQGHFKKHVKDHHSRQGLLKLVGQRRRLLDYIKRKNIGQYRQLIEQLGIRK